MTNYTELRRKQSIIVLNNMLNDFFDNFKEPIRTNNLVFTSANGRYRMTCNFSIGDMKITEPIIWHKGAVEYKERPFEMAIIKSRVGEFIKTKMVQL